jgi:hypothetical protein
MKMLICRQYCRSPQLFRCALSVLADGLAHFFVGGDPLPEAATADNLLFRRRRFLQRNAALAVQLTYRAPALR